MKLTDIPAVTPVNASAVVRARFPAATNDDVVASVAIGTRGGQASLTIGDALRGIGALLEARAKPGVLVAVFPEALERSSSLPAPARVPGADDVVWVDATRNAIVAGARVR